MNIRNFFLSCIVLGSFTACKKLVEIKLPVNTITTQGAFTDSANATSSVLGIYSTMRGADVSTNFSYGGITIYGGCSADELIPYDFSSTDLQLLYDNNLQSQNSITYSAIWYRAYNDIFNANSCIDGLNSSKTINQSIKNQLIGEATFLRVFCYFYLVNLYGDVPYITSSVNWQQTQHAYRTSKIQIYQKLISDLNNCHQWLKNDYSISGNERTRATQMAASALLARIELYKTDYKDAIGDATSVISNSNYILETDLHNVFKPNSDEAILQWASNSERVPFNITAEGFNILPADSSSPPGYYCSPQLIKAFEPGDNRKSVWIDSVNYGGINYYYPHKYILGSADISQNASAPQYYTVMRLAEQYLIRADANANLGNLTYAISDLNIIRSRAGLKPLSATLTESQVLAAVAQEWRIEFFSEWGYRWLNLKRTNQVDAVMSIVTPSKSGGRSWKTNQQLYPIPRADIQSDPNLSQNPGY